MKPFKKGRYSGFLKRFSYIMDLAIINAAVFLFEINITDVYLFALYSSVFWVLIAVWNDFYEVQRYTKIIQVINLIFRQLIVYSIILYAFIGFFKQPNISRLALGQYLAFVFFIITFFKFLVYYLLKR